jgi:hypothetical protein
VAATPSLRVVKTSPFKGGTRTWSNRYHFNGGTPADATHWHTLMDAVTTAEKAIFQSGTHIVEAIGYQAGSEVPVASKVYSLAGTLTLAAGWFGQAPEVVGLARFATAARTTKNHPIYCFNYFHQVSTDPSGGYWDQLHGTQKTAMTTYCSSLISGFSDGSITAVRASPNGAAATGVLVEEWVTHRDFPYSTSV